MPRKTPKAALQPADFATLYPVETKPDAPDRGRWIHRGVEDWRSGFFPGVLWELHRHTGDPAMRTHALAWTEGIAALQDRPIDHDLGFRFVPTFGQAIVATNDAEDPTGVFRSRTRATLERAAFALEIALVSAFTGAAHLLLSLDGTSSAAIAAGVAVLVAPLGVYGCAVGVASDFGRRSYAQAGR